MGGNSYTFSKGGISELNSSAFEGKDSYDISELGLVPYILAFANDGFRAYPLLPIFPLRLFRHKSIFVRTDGPIKEPKDLVGARVGTPGYSSTSLTWIRGFLKDEYGVSPKDIQWIIPSRDSSSKFSGKASKNENIIPDNIKIEYDKSGDDESEMLLSGKIDVLFHAAQPKAFAEGNPAISRLFLDSRKTEQEYFKKTGIFPIMHSVGVKRDLLESNPDFAQTVFKAFSNAKTKCFQQMSKLGWVYDSLPWYGQELESTYEVMGKNYWSYGVSKNIKTIQTLCDYCYGQGLAKKKIKAEDMFFESSLNFEE